MILQNQRFLSCSCQDFIEIRINKYISDIFCLATLLFENFHMRNFPCCHVEIRGRRRRMEQLHGWSRKSGWKCATNRPDTSHDIPTYKPFILPTCIPKQTLTSRLQRLVMYKPGYFLIFYLHISTRALQFRVKRIFNI